MRTDGSLVAIGGCTEPVPADGSSVEGIVPGAADSAAGPDAVAPGNGPGDDVARLPPGVDAQPPTSNASTIGRGAKRDTAFIPRITRSGTICYEGSAALAPACNG
jgi:hypothetical protein